MKKINVKFDKIDGFVNVREILAANNSVNTDIIRDELMYIIDLIWSIRGQTSIHWICKRVE